MIKPKDSTDIRIIQEPELPILGAHRALLYLLCFEHLEDVMHEEAVGALAQRANCRAISNTE